MGVVKDFVIRIRSDLTGLNKGYDSAQRQTKKWRTGTEGEVKKMRGNLDREVEGINRSFGRIAGGAVFAYGIKKFAEYDKAIQTTVNRIPALHGETRKVFEENAKGIQKVTRLTKIQGMEVGAGIYNVTRDAELMNKTMSTAAMVQSQLGLTSADSANVASNAWKGFNMVNMTTEQRTKKLNDVYEDLYAASQGTAQQQRAYNEALNASDPLAFARAMEEINGSLGDYHSTLKDDAIKDSKTFSAQLQDVGGNLSTVGENIGSALIVPLKIVSGALAGITNLIDKNPLFKPIVWIAAAAFIWKTARSVMALANFWKNVTINATEAAAAQRTASVQTTLPGMGPAAGTGGMTAMGAAGAVAGGLLLGQSINDVILPGLDKFAKKNIGGKGKGWERTQKLLTMGLSPLMAVGGISAGLAGVGTVGGNLNKIGHAYDLKHFASGGIVNRPTQALIGESGPEAIVPLRRNGSGRIQANGGGGIHVAFNAPVYMRDKSDIDRVTHEFARSVYTMLAGAPS